MGSAATPASYPIGTGTLTPGVKWRVSRPRMSGVLPQFPQYVFMAWYFFLTV